ncbi:MAG: PAS domain S-box protein, partial [Bacteroidota bacterium]|nr:PAS domain S-box protein [Bacteroidota bacterium]
MDYNELKNAFEALQLENVKLRKRNHMLHKLLGGLPVILSSIDDEGNTSESLGAGLKELGLENHQLIGTNVYKLYPQAINIRLAIEKKEEVSFVGSASINGIVRHFKNFFFPDHEEGGVIGFSIDITDQILIQEKFKDQETFVKHVVSATPDIIYVYDLDQRKNLFINREMADILGYSNQEIFEMGASIYQKVIHPDDLCKFEERNIAIRNSVNDDVHRMEIRVINKDNEWRWFEARSTPFKRTAEGKAYQLIAIARDVTEIKQASQKLQESELFIKQITEATPDIIYVYDILQERYIYFNREFSEMLGYEEGKFKASGNAINQFVFHPEDKHIWLARYEKYNKAKDDQNIEDEVRVKHANGYYIWMFSSAKVFKRTADGKVWQVLGTAKDITKRKEAEEALIKTNREHYETKQSLQKLYNELEDRVKQRTFDVEKQREHLYSVFMKAPAGMALLKGPDHIYELANDHYHKIVSKKELIGKAGREAIPELESQGIWDIIDDVYNTENPYFGNELPLILFNDSSKEFEERFFNFMIMPVHDINNKIESVLIHAIDITEQIAAHQELKKSTIRLKAVYESLPQMAWTALPNGQINYYNNGWYRYTGQTPEESLGDGWVNAVHPEDVPETLRSYKEALKYGKIWETQSRFRKSETGEYRWHLVRSVPLKNEHGELYLNVGTSTDIHDQKESEENFRFLAEFVPQIFWTALDNGLADYFNHRFYSYTGLMPEQSLGWGWTSAVYPDDYHKAIEIWTESFQSGSDYQIEYRLHRAEDKSYRWHLVRGVPLKDKDGKILKWFGTCTDIHDNKVAQQELQERNLALSIINNIGKKISGELDITKLVQEVTDATTKISGAEFGAFFYNVIDENGENFTLYSISGVGKEHFSKFPLPRNTEFISPTFHNKGTIRVSDITKDPHYGKNTPHYGMPQGHLPVRSYMAVSVVSRSGEVVGGLFFGNSQPGVFTEQAEAIVEGIAAQAAIAIDNSRLFEKQNATLESLAKTKQQLSEINAEVSRKNDELIRIN